MKKRWYLSFLCIAVITTIHAQIFWEISGNGLTKPSYLLGTHHLIEKEQIPGFDQILTYVPQTDLVIGEMDMSKLMSMQLKMAQAAIMKDSTIQQLVSEADYKLLDSEFNELMGKGMDQLGRLKPSMLSSIYAVMLYTKENQRKKEPEAIDIVVQNAGKKAKKKVMGLETVEQQIDILFNSTPLKHQAELLVEAVKEKDKATEILRELNKAYLAGDLNKMTELSKEDSSSKEEDMQIMLYDRNVNWATQLSAILPKTSCFIAVGCLHLPEEKGLIRLLRDLGYTVEPVKL